MATSPKNRILQHVRRAVLLQHGADLTDGQLLGSFIEQHDEAAFALLMRRHGPMVWSVCRRVLANHHDAEDAFQATFLVLVRKADSIVPREMLPNWLYGVAHQTALKARATKAKRQARERQVAQMPEPVVVQRDLWHELQSLLDQELSRLPDKYRVAIVLCDLEGKTRKEAARRLGCPEGTLAARLARARTMLAKRLGRHGLAVSGGALAAVLAQNAVSACAPISVMSSTIKAASLLAAGQAAAVGLISVKVVALTEGVMKTMLLSKLKFVTALLLAVGVAGAGSGGLLYRMQSAGAAPIEQEEKARAEDSLPSLARLAKQVQHLQKAVDELQSQVKQLLNDTYHRKDLQPPFGPARPERSQRPQNFYRSVPGFNLNEDNRQPKKEKELQPETNGTRQEFLNQLPKKENELQPEPEGKREEFLRRQEFARTARQFDAELNQLRDENAKLKERLRLMDRELRQLRKGGEGKEEATP